MSSITFADPVTNQSTIEISKTNVNAHPVTAEIINSTIPMANGGVNHDNGIPWAAQATFKETGGSVSSKCPQSYRISQSWWLVTYISFYKFEKIFLRTSV